MLTVENIDVFYGSVQILHKVSFCISMGRITTLLGGNGMGKTTALRTLSGILKPKAGKIEFLEERIDTLSPSEIVKLGLSHVPQEREIFKEMTVVENLELGACIRKNKAEIKEDIAHMYNYFPMLKENEERAAGLLSGGQQQMLAIARGLMARPKLLMLDEPSSGLAPIIVGEIAKIIERLHEEGINILLVEQNVQMALRLSEHSYILRSGQIVFEGPTRELKDGNVFKKYID
jgi:branched-chain amino acid transport system ATP-binding protein